MADRDIVTYLQLKSAATEIAADDILMLIKADGSIEQLSGAVLAGPGALVATEACQISGNAITLTSTAQRVVCTVDTSGPASENLTAINGGVAGMTLILHSANDARDPTVVKGGTLYLQADFIMESTKDVLTLLCTAANTWIETSRASNT